MRRRKQKDKRVLKSRYSQPPKQKRRIRNKSRNRKYYGPKRQSQTSKTTMLIVILALVAFVAGAGVGVSMALGVFDDGSDDSVQVENVTVKMTTNLNQSNDISFDEADHVDYNENQSSEILGAEDNPYFNDDGLAY